MCMNPSNYLGPTSLDSPRSNMSPNALLGTMGGGQTLGLGEWETFTKKIHSKFPWGNILPEPSEYSQPSLSRTFTTSDPSLPQTAVWELFLYVPVYLDLIPRIICFLRHFSLHFPNSRKWGPTVDQSNRRFTKFSWSTMYPNPSKYLEI